MKLNRFITEKEFDELNEIKETGFFDFDKLKNYYGISNKKDTLEKDELDKLEKINKFSSIILPPD